VRAIDPPARATRGAAGARAALRARAGAVAVAAATLVASLAGASAAAASGGRIAYTAGTDFANVWTMNADGSGRAELGPGSHPVVSPNGALVAASSVGEGGSPAGGIVLYPAAGEEPIPIPLNTADATALAFSPDSKYLAVALTGEGGRGQGLAVVDLETDAVTDVTSGTAEGASFNPAGGDELVFARDASASPRPKSPTNLYTWSPSGGPPKQITSDGRSLFPVWGAGYIAYDHQTPDRFDVGGNRLSELQSQIWLRYPDGATHQLTHMRLGYLQVGLVPVAVSSTGSHMIAELEQQDIPMAYAVEVPDGRAHPLLPKAISFADGITADGTRALVGRFYYGGQHNAILSVPFGGGRPTVLLMQNRVGELSWNE
jgi:hypothetical protein